MFGAIIGDIVGSRFEFHNNKTKDFRFFHSRCRITDDSVLSIAVCKSLLQFDGDYEQFEKIVCKNI
ncbi:MAG: hypothetical protein IJT59_05725 [Desulfovibrionaceae bacterium]|nr:hypothetical protein [Desulfovibrionaceae bacterium]